MAHADDYAAMIDAVQVPYLVRAVPAQLSPNDRRCYFGHMAGRFEARGAIVDAGTLAGGTSVALTAGALASKAMPLPEVHAYDRFECDWHTPGFFKGEFNLDLQPGSNFRAVYEDMIAPFRRLVTIHDGDLLTADWIGKPIETLSLDICKSPALADQAVRLFLPCLIPGGFVLHQDYKTIWLPWIHVWMERLSKYFVRLYETPLGSTVVFQSIRPIPPDDVVRLLSDPLTVDRAVALAQQAASRALSRETRTFVELASVILVCQRSRDTAARLLEDIVITGHTEDMAGFFAERKAELRSYLASQPD
jgi:hypothetical protein